MNKQTTIKAAFIFWGIISISGCAPVISGAMNATVTDDVVIDKTAKYFGVSKKEISVASIDKGVLATSYQTRYAGKLYNCTIYYGEVTCKQPGT